MTIGGSGGSGGSIHESANASVRPSATYCLICRHLHLQQPINGRCVTSGVKSRAAYIRDRARLERCGHDVDRKLTFRFQGCHYVVIRTKKGELLVLVNGKLSKSPSKAVLKKARRDFFLLDVEEVHST